MRSLDGANRLIASLLGLALVAGGGCGLARSTGVVGDAGDPVMAASLRRSLIDNAGVAGGAATFVALVVAWAGWRWLGAQLRPAPSLGEVSLAAGDDGQTWLDARAVAEAVVRDLEAQAGVASARVRVIGHADAPAVDLHAELADGADLTDVRRQVERAVVERLRSALERPHLPVTVRYRPAGPAGRAVL